MALDYIESHAGGDPFALFISWNPPHSPYDLVPQEYLDLYPEDVPLKKNVDLTNIHHHTYEPVGYTKEEAYAGYQRILCCQYLVWMIQFGRLIKRLKELGIYDDTIIVLSAGSWRYDGLSWSNGKACVV